MSIRLEKDVQAKILKYLKERDDCWAVKIMSCNRNGTPDILACIGGRFCGFEVKSASGRVEPLQEVQIERIIEAGGVAGVVRSVADVEALLDGTK